ncbi:MAG TPA: hypothetical protein PKD55_13010 [Bellilinea sp.]|nr:hypothetical protein [Bellilinea sp.]
MLQLDLTALKRKELENVAEAMFTALGTYALLNQRLYDAFKDRSKDDLPALVEAWAEAIAQADDRAEARIHDAIKPAIVMKN